MSVAYDVKIVGAQRLEIRFDVFNLANRKNISSVNNIIGLDPSTRPRPSARSPACETSGRHRSPSAIDSDWCDAAWSGAYFAARRARASRAAATWRAYSRGATRMKRS